MRSSTRHTIFDRLLAPSIALHHLLAPSTAFSRLLTPSTAPRRYAPNNQGNVIRACVQELTGAVTFPQVVGFSPALFGSARAVAHTRTLMHSHDWCPAMKSPSRACTPKFPAQVFIGGEFFGGAADACMKWKSGELQPVLEKAGAKPEGEWNDYKGDPFEFLPKWYASSGYQVEPQS